MHTPSKAWTRSRSPSTTRTLTRTVSPGVMRVLEQPLGETLLSQCLGATDDARQQPHTRIDQRDRRRLAARQHEIAEAHLLDRPRFKQALVDAFEPAADQPHTRRRR